MNLRRALLLGIATLSLSAQAALTTVGTPQVQFDGKGPAGFRLQGTTHELKADDQGEQFVFTVPLATLQTGIALRDRHMREKYLQTDQYPNAVLKLRKDALQLPADGQTQKGTANGELTLHGQTKPVQLSYTIVRVGNRYDVQAAIPLKLSDFGIEQPKYLGLTVQPDIATSVTFSVQMTS